MPQAAPPSGGPETPRAAKKPAGAAAGGTHPLQQQSNAGGGGVGVPAAGAHETGGGGGDAGPQMNLGAVRHAALQERCRQVLGELFPTVYEYLRDARQRLADEKEVRVRLQAIVGRDRLNECMCVDELIFTEQMEM